MYVLALKMDLDADRALNRPSNSNPTVPNHLLMGHVLWFMNYRGVEWDVE